MYRLYWSYKMIHTYNNLCNNINYIDLNENKIDKLNNNNIIKNI